MLSLLSSAINHLTNVQVYLMFLFIKSCIVVQTGSNSRGVTRCLHTDASVINKLNGSEISQKDKNSTFAVFLATSTIFSVGFSMWNFHLQLTFLFPLVCMNLTTGSEYVFHHCCLNNWRCFLCWQLTIKVKFMHITIVPWGKQKMASIWDDFSSWISYKADSLY